jgi:hypothetical protein
MTKKYNQSGGAFVILAWIGQFILEIVKGVLIFIKDIIKICPNDQADDWKGCFKNLGWRQLNPKKWEWGGLWYYLKWCVKTVIYIIIFCFGGPVVILVGVAYLYSQLFTKLGERTDGLDPSNINKDENNNKNNKSN